MLRTISTLGALGLWVAMGAAVPASAQTVVQCAREGGFCRVPYPTEVIYGARGYNAARFVEGRGIPCNNGVFGDPVPRVIKSCSYVVRDFERRRYRRYD
jgi:hypothetical protein